MFLRIILVIFDQQYLSRVKMISGCIKNVTIELTNLENPYMNPEIMSLALLDFIQPKTQVNNSDSSYKPWA